MKTRIAVPFLILFALMVSVAFASVPMHSTAIPITRSMDGIPPTCTPDGIGGYPPCPPCPSCDNLNGWAYLWCVIRTGCRVPSTKTVELPSASSSTMIPKVIDKPEAAYTWPALKRVRLPGE